MTKKITDKDLEKVDGGGMTPIDDLQENPGLDPKNTGDGGTGTGTPGSPGGGIYDDMQQNPPDGGPTTP